MRSRPASNGMKAVKIYLAVVTGLLVVALCFGIYVWFKLQTLQGVIPKNIAEQEQVSDSTVKDPSQNDVPSVVPAEEGDIVVEKADLTPAQVRTLETLGFEMESIVVTKEMILCMETAVGEERMAEIIDGAAPGPLESIKLLGCVK